MFRKINLSIELALKSLRSNIGRTVLTLSGIVIGITSVIVIMSSGQAVKNFILSQFSSYGPDVISIKTKTPSVSKVSIASAAAQAEGVTVTTLKLADAKEIKKLPNVSDAVAASVGQQVVSYQNQNKLALLYGAGADIPNVDSGVKMARGQFYEQSDDDSLAQVTVLGSDVANVLFGQDDPVGKYVKIKNFNFKVVGVLQSRGAVTLFNYDDLVYIPEQTLQKKILGVDYVQAIVVKVRDVNAINETVADITDVLRRQHHIANPNQDDFTVTTIQQAEDIVSSVFNTITILLLVLTSISLIVGGVGIMNVMYVAVVERTFEIGLRKAVGARAADILKQFLFEAIIVTLVGGIIGIVLGFLLSLGFSYVLASLGFALEFSVTGTSIVVATVFSMATGIVFGFYPAVKASKLSPMEALRKE